MHCFIRFSINVLIFVHFYKLPIQEHIEKRSKFPVTCPNNCGRSVLQRNGKDTISSKSNLDLFEYGANSRFLKPKLDHRENTCYISNE